MKHWMDSTDMGIEVIFNKHLSKLMKEGNIPSVISDNLKSLSPLKKAYMYWEYLHLQCEKRCTGRVNVGVYNICARDYRNRFLLVFIYILKSIEQSLNVSDINLRQLWISLYNKWLWRHHGSCCVIEDQLSIMQQCFLASDWGFCISLSRPHLSSFMLKIILFD